MAILAILFFITQYSAKRAGDAFCRIPKNSVNIRKIGTLKDGIIIAIL